MNLFSLCRTAGICLSALAILSGCKDDANTWPTVDGGAPNLALVTNHERTEAGLKIKIAGKVTDADGISTIDLVCHDIDLNKRINLIDIYGEPLKEYDLDYEFKIEEDQEGDDFNIDIIITDVGGRQEKQTMRLTLDADWTPPYFTTNPDSEIIVLLKSETVFNLSFSVADNRVVDYAEIDLKDVTDGEANAKDIAGFPRRVDGDGSKTLSFSEKIVLPNKAANLLATVTAYDREANEAAHSVTFTSLVKVQELQDFNKMWLCDVADEADLNTDIFGVPILCDHIGPFKYQVRYYNEKAGTEVCLLGQKGSFGPLCFAPSKENGNVLGDNPEEVNRIKLDKAGMYYLLEFDTYNRTYSTKSYSVAEAIDPVMHMHFGKDDLNTWWGGWDTDAWWQKFYFCPMPDSPGSDAMNEELQKMKMEQDPKNPHIYVYSDWDLTKGDNLHFVLHNWHSHGWWNFVTWRVDDSEDPGKFMYYGNVHPDNPHYTGNKDYFDWKYGSAVNIESWGDEGYRKNFVPDNWVDIPSLDQGGKFKLIFDAHTERARLVPQK